jgi:arylsulfatase A-like enzyme
VSLGVPYSGQTVQQVDIVPTLALLLGLPIPQSSVGAVAFDALSDFINEKKLLLAFINAQQLLRTIKNGFENYVNGEKVI